MADLEQAVSPVIGVLLMLTLTLIIAAIVNSYAGGLVETEPKAPSVTIQATYSQTQGMEIRHISGDPLPTSAVKVMVKPSESFGRNASQFSSFVNKKYITNATGLLSWDGITTSMRPGDVFYILRDNLSYLQDIPEQSYWFNESVVPDNRGKTFYLEFYYKNTMISRSEVLIET
ncbi:MAG: type IV pilin N-terminal domain-containing protein [Methanospirillum sp.]|uniref:type IV pilin N-terminal domain-containing protein n=1 Tax=Methanospirillum sp. TaxID=45200 RepID=UPI0023715E46|nr:type IV pilin N-terminal domain-containing protein [Methanospirillum sp.]MDD1728833.1 type IV pilin N-terminal domain-containing protein [Methanospirillum sp.]